VGVTSKSSITVSLLLAIVLALLAGPALALGLGQLTVKSQPGQPLLAEIPIISSDPSELEDLQARLASPDTFRRVGLQPPDMEVSGLQFAVALDARGNPVIRVTSTAPLTQPLLTFLLEVDWGEGRLVREYSALVDVPRTVAAPLQPIQAPTVAPPNTIVRTPEVAAAPAPAPAAPVPPPTPAAVPAPAPAAPPAATAIPTPAPVAVAAAPEPVAAPPAPAPPPSDEYAVRAGDTLSGIAAGLRPGGYNLDQTMLALLRSNPGAFIGDNINRLKAGAVLRMPQADELSRYSTGEAAAVVRAQVAQWREARAPQQQPAAVARADAGRTSAANTNGRAGAASATAQARLEIVPPSSGRGQAGTRSGIQAGGEGEMLRQQELQETKEALAARDAEVGDLKARVAELEKLQQQQQQLIAMKDSALAAAQQNLAKANTAAAQPATQATTQQPAQPVPEKAGSGAWMWIGLALLVAALAGWLLTRRRASAPRPRIFDAEALAASVPPPVSEEAVVVPEAPEGIASGVEPIADDVLAPAPAQAPHWTAAPALVGTVPTWHGATPESAAPAAAVRETTDPAQQLELARAYLDLGDDDAARELLREVLDGRDPAARETAARMLREL
jgi:pilus assembly protein FimV